MEYGLTEKSSGKSVALKAVDVTGTLAADALQITSTQKYLNDSGKNAELIYTFPLPENAAVHDFAARIGETHVSGRIMERDQAFKEYDQAIRSGDSSILLESVRPNVFQVSLGQIDADEEVEIAISYFQEIKNIDTEMRISIPMLLAPRFIPGKPLGKKIGPGRAEPTDRVPDADFISPPIGETGYRATLSLHVHNNTPISSIKSPSHKIRIDRMDEYSATITLQENNTRMNRDFVLNLKLDGETVPRIIYWKNPKDEYFACITYTPELPIIEQRQPKEYIFLIDISRSMEGKKIEHAADAIQICLRNLDEGDSFNLLAFESENHAFAPKSLPYNQENLDKASAWVKNLHAMGGTNILPAVQLALKEAGDQQKVVILATDGQVGNENEIINYVRKRNQNLCLFSLGIDTAVNSYFINQIAEAGNGCAEFSYPGESLEEKMLRHFARINATSMDNVTFSLPNISAYDWAETPPSRLYDMEPYTHLIRLAAPPQEELLITGDCCGQKMVLKVDQIIKIENAEILEKLWAKRKITQLETYLQTGNPRRASGTKEEIVSLSERYHILSTLTSFIAEFERKDKLSGIPETIIIPVDAPHAWGMFEDHVSYFSAGGFGFIGGAAISNNQLESALFTKKDIINMNKDILYNHSKVDSELKSYRMSQKSDSEDQENKLNKLAAEQNADGSFGRDQGDPRSQIEVTCKAIVTLCENGQKVNLFRQQILKAISYLMLMSDEVLADTDLTKITISALESARNRRIIRKGSQQLDFLKRLRSIDSGAFL
ncbi:VIT and vWA domain-containing protein [Syntrophomonas wolfei]|uniref:Uncharacterized protein n=1 Tax=Syntrophomonas wolfei subsp. wolfei (strain DSM 2245B / Goettingen) TaxID=335541 RepID=Q0AV90_SYNWW|nr:VIT and VWA domain-containing protein [Syntrophomonas wolfei]ABI69364.1 hypothetical protein Swol_2070 [Syntrophomonas wolfei subsp. wolfei str. Goettingen G311]